MNNPNGLYKASYTLGEQLVFFVKLHIFWLFFSLKGALILGVFPASATVIQALIYSFDKKEIPPHLYQWFSLHYKENFKQANQLGFIYAVIVGILWLDVRVAGSLIKNPVIHTILIVFFASGILLGLHLFPCFIRYELRLRDYFKQSFLLMISSIPQTIAIIVGVFVATAASTFFPILVPLAAVPLFMLPISFFSFQAMQKVEKNNVTQLEE